MRQSEDFQNQIGVYGFTCLDVLIIHTFNMARFIIGDFTNV